MADKHTAGPWEAQPLAMGAFGIWDGINRLVAETRGTASTVDQRAGSPSTAEAIAANARLIAAAPAMLEALRRVLAESHNPVVERLAQAGITEACKEE